MSEVPPTGDITMELPGPTAGGHVEQPLPRASDGPIMHDLVAADLMDLAGGAPAAAMMTQRKQVGIARYGQPLRAWNGRDAGRDAREEVLDLLVYLRQQIEEGATKVYEEYRVALWLACRLVRSAGTLPEEIDRGGS